jgi:capsular exopolysaccharide synthesis family protein
MAEFPASELDARAPADGAQETEPLSRLIARYWILLKKYYWILIATCVLAVVGAYFFTQRQPRIYRASSEIIFRGTSNVLGRKIDQVDLVDPGGLWHFEQFWNTQKEVMSSRWFAERVVEREALVDTPGFIKNAGSMDPDAAKRRAAARVLGMTSVSLQPNSRVATVTVETTNPEHAQMVADGVAEAYVQYTRDYQSGGLNTIIDWFDDYVGQKRTELNDAQTELHKFKRDHNILSVSFEERQNLTAANMSAVNSQLNEVRSQLDDAESMLHQINSMDRKGTDLRTLAQIVDSGSLSGALSSEQQLEQDLARLTTRYGENHEKVREVSRQLDVVRTNIEKQISRIRSGIEARVAKLKKEESRKQARLAALKEEAFELNELGLQYNRIKDRAESLRQLYETVLTRSEELDINSMYESNSIEILQHAEVPGGPIRPNLPINLAIGLAIGALLGLSLIVLIDSLDNTVRRESDVERYTSKPILGHLPQIDKALLKEFGSVDTMTEIAPRSQFAEGIKSLRTNLMFISEKTPQLLLVTSPGPGEGKTLISINMSIAMAHSGQRTLIVDSDMRRPRVHNALGLENNTGLSNVIMGNATIEDVVQDTGIENLSAISCGEIPPNPLELLHTERFEKVVEELRASYDRVIFDSPPLAAVSDGLVLSHSVDAVLLILKFGQTRQELLRRSIEQLEALGSPFMGCVLNDISADAGSAYAYSYYYYRYRYDSDGDGKAKKPTRLAS